MASILTAAQREQLHRQLDQLLDELPADLENLQDAERQLHDGMRRLATAGMQAWADSAGTASAPPECPCCHRPMRHRGLKRRWLVTVVGGGKGVADGVAVALLRAGTANACGGMWHRTE